MYEFSTKAKKKREWVIFAGSMLVGGASFGFSMLPRVLYPMLYQLLAVCAFVLAVMVLVRYLMRDYLFCISPREDAPEGLPDLTVTEVYGRRKSVVCRISLGDIVSVEQVTKENRKRLAQKQRGKQVYAYTGQMRAQTWLLEIRQGEEVFFLRIEADERQIQHFKVL